MNTPSDQLEHLLDEIAAGRIDPESAARQMLGQLLVDPENRLSLPAELRPVSRAAPAHDEPLAQGFEHASSHLAAHPTSRPAAPHRPRRPGARLRTTITLAVAGALIISITTWMHVTREPDTDIGPPLADPSTAMLDSSPGQSDDGQTESPAGPSGPRPGGEGQSPEAAPQSARPLGWDNPLLAGTDLAHQPDSDLVTESTADAGPHSAEAQVEPAAVDAAAQVQAAVDVATPLESANEAAQSASDDPADPLPADFGAVTDEVAEQQRTARRVETTVAIPLPSPTGQDADQSFRLIDAPVHSLRWQMPGDASVDLMEVGPGRWKLVAADDDATLAQLVAAEHGLAWSWSPPATDHPTASQLAAGRLSWVQPDGQRGELYLRPQLRDEPIRCAASQADLRLSWSLEGPPLFDDPQLQVEVDSPRGIELSWIEVSEPTDIRSNVSVLQWTPVGQSTPAIRCQVEARVGSRLRLRLRYSVQLDPALPWQPLAEAQLDAAIEHVAAVLDRQLWNQSELGRQYAVASVTLRRQLRPRKELLDAQVTQLQTFLQRLQQLHALASDVSTAELTLTLTTSWPDRRQTIFEMVPTDTAD